MRLSSKREIANQILFATDPSSRRRLKLAGQKSHLRANFWKKFRETHPKKEN